MRITRFFDKLEDKVRARLSHYPIVYGLVAGVGVVFFWRGVWHIADNFFEAALGTPSGPLGGLSSAPWWDGLLSIIVGAMILLLTGSFVSSFIGNEIIISGLRGEKRVAEKTESEVKESASTTDEIRRELGAVAGRLEEIEQKISKRG